MNVMTEAGDDVGSERFVGRQEGHAYPFVRALDHTVRRDSEPDGLPTLRINGLHVGVLSQHAWQEQGVPGAPGMKPDAVDTEGVRHFGEGQPPEADDAVVGVTEDAGP